MRVLLLHNPTAGDGHPSPQEMIQAFQRAGHEVLYRSTRAREWAAALGASVQVTVAAGGDGTVGRKSSPRASPMRHELRWRFGPPKDLGGNDGSWNRPGSGSSRPCSGRDPRRPGRGGREARVRRRSAAAGGRGGVRRLLEALRAQPPWSLAIEADGQDHSGDYLLAVGLNTPSIGPDLELAPGAQSGDALLDLVLVGEADRRRMLTWLERFRSAAPDPAPLTSHPIRRLRLGWIPGHGHCDDEVWPPDTGARGPGPAEVSMRLLKRIPVLVPRVGDPRP